MNQHLHFATCSAFIMALSGCAICASEIEQFSLHVKQTQAIFAAANGHSVGE